MGEIAEMMMEGMLCQCCGVYLESSKGDYPQMCYSCEQEARQNELKNATTSTNKQYKARNSRKFTR